MVHGSSGWSDQCVLLPCYLWAACVHVAFIVQKAQDHSHEAWKPPGLSETGDVRDSMSLLNVGWPVGQEFVCLRHVSFKPANTHLLAGLWGGGIWLPWAPGCLPVGRPSLQFLELIRRMCFRTMSGHLFELRKMRWVPSSLWTLKFEAQHMHPPSLAGRVCRDISELLDVFGDMPGSLHKFRDVPRTFSVCRRCPDS